MTSFVDRKFFRSCERFPIAVARVCFRKHLTRLLVSPGHVANKPLSIAFVHVEIHGLKQAAYMNLMQSLMVLCSKMKFA